jgi:multiple sugar transport system ATP-binding protein
MADVQLRNIRKSYGAVNVIKGVDIDIKDGEFVVFVGPSGCGKSTLLRMIAGLEDITSGELKINGKVVNDVQPKERGIAMVFQSYAIFPHMTVRENVGFGLTIAKASKEEKERKVGEAARILQMEHLLDRNPAQLSGGQRQRVAIGRAIVRNPEVFLFDEPLSNLDAALRMDMRMEIGKLHKQLDATMVYVTHDQVEAMTLADKIVVLKDGLVQQIGAPMDLYHNPANLFVAGFLGSPSMNFMDVEVSGSDSSGTKISAPALDPIIIPANQVKEAVTGKGKLCVRPQYLSIAERSSAGALHGNISLVERLGTETVVNVELARGGRIVAALSEDAPLQVGSEIALTFDPAKAHLFAANAG